MNRKRIINQRDQAPTTSYQCNPVLWKHIWKAAIQPKIKFFLWSACQNALPTLDNLYRRRAAPAPICPICNIKPETIEHTLLLCPWVTQIWKEPGINLIWLQMYYGAYGRIEIILSSGRAPSTSTTPRKMATPAARCPQD